MAKVLQLLLLLVFLYQPASAEQALSTASSTADESLTKTLLWPDGTRYVGGVDDGKRSGKGTIFWQDGTRFVGTFVNDKRNGPGTMILPDGTVYNGYFENDTLVERSDGVAIGRSEPTAPIAQISADNMPAMLASADSLKPETEPKPKDPKPADPKAVEPESVTSAEVSTPAMQPITTLSKDTRTEVQGALDLWASAWSDQNLEQYLSAYSVDFDVPGRQSRRQWEGLRRSRLSRPSRIEIRLAYKIFEVIAPDTVQVDFDQVYDSNLFSDKTDKRLVLKKEDDNWRIISEESL
ncbi:MAG: hypothetical protein ACJAYE_000352 [Candidatus Azotimanducaceae bacterium]|jgi:hypothetical protein